ncbi:Amidohydrolase 1 domain and Metal-dependent hydrolase, composite domain-containing protein [Strongyloides ratti]|uniref:Amidohydrolase 1 domain and Metal-dependent hydrolase, composite domain-containing protein n=1 Tax=Strongyloides ratti TaxID=34506 RepID=A0A090MY92_STRRB|nr:Amidohydrolase 1 domain and Metal-dependent hydrolase, composite domain-containing protein [Strongyloides ratti]CEF66779.1 Amidohydrolase 1 domain and Metal-dependent hydrolase, composite domain-containing protein [Strongyloides ratti]
MFTSGKIFTAPFIWNGDEFLKNYVIKANNDGVIEEVVPFDELSEKEKLDVVMFQDQIILPGFVNCHSHSFHRFLRGKSCIGTPGEENFWKWRDNMYSLVQNIDYKKMLYFCKITFKEMVEAGITTVGEFHYLHHSNIKEKNFDLDKAVIEAATEIGIRLVLIVTLYTFPGLNRSEELNQTQKHFECIIDEFIEHLNNLKKTIKMDNVSIGVAAHSIRAVDENSLKKLWIFYCMKYLCRRPSEIILENFKSIGPVNLTAVHCSFTTRKLMNELKQNDTKICVCPLTEGYLGDNIPILDSEDQIVLGSDCNNRISMLEEARWLAFGQHLRNNNRNHGKFDANKLIKILTENGSKSLGLEKTIGKLEKGYKLDFTTIKLKSTVMRETQKQEDINDSIIFSCDNKEIGNVYVNGKMVYSCC